MLGLMEGFLFSIYFFVRVMLMLMSDDMLCLGSDGWREGNISKAWCRVQLDYYPYTIVWSR